LVRTPQMGLFQQPAKGRGGVRAAREHVADAGAKTPPAQASAHHAAGPPGCGMNPVALHLASGASLFSGGLLLVLGGLLAWWARGRWAGRLRSLLGWLGLVLLLGSTPPWPLWGYALIGAIFLAWVLAEEIGRVQRIVPPHLPRIAVICLSLLLMVQEVPYLRPPRVPPTQARHLYIVGDSISAGITSAYPPWPTVLAAKYNLPVTNLAVAGATIAEGIVQAAKVNESNVVVLIELGGNDLLSGLPSRDFARHLEAFLASLQRPGRILVMMELPLVPLYPGYGRAQRGLAQKYDVHLIPKRYFSAVLSARGATDDGLHLSEAGARLMADTLYPILAPALGR